MPAKLLAAAFAPSRRQLRYRLGWYAFAFILVAGSIPGARAGVGEVASGYVLHAVAYASITVLLVTGSLGRAGARALKGAATVAAMGAADEVLQSFLPYRTGAVGDWLIDVGAAAVAALSLYLLARNIEPGRAPDAADEAGAR